ncbi:chloroplast envelope quinone oxidoreductase homolog [Phragmites australis]|uniref:chloroplast envelope quinone oxidoreductase homolog n=1 Tax=Phragmites australis TaxID=29695 RepID=UPI002D76AC27|nr:chloroplast envelope quinone oxidoreductase homolog [Phragmites australis]
MATPKKTMRALQYDKYGGGAEGLKHVEVPIPSPKKGEVLLKMEAASINPIDWKIQKGMLRPFLPRTFPVIPVGDLSGEVVELGNGVTNFKPGDKVISISFPNGGGLAEYAVAPASLTVSRPPEVSAAEGACLPTAAATALQQLKTAGVNSFDGFSANNNNAPKNVLVTAASGGVGHYAVQLAKLAGLHATATCGARNLGFVRGLGADEVLDYKTHEGAKLQSPSGRKYDAVVHCATGTPWSVFAPVLADNCKVVDVTPGIAAAAKSFLQKVTFSKKRLVPLVLMPKKEEMEWLVDMAKQGKLKTVIDSKYPLSRAHEAWAKSIEGHATGKIVVEMGGAE